ncbi:MAG TPA: peptide chain release factor N(5)-glutamine methyltransferase [Nitrospirota bacterium]|jgi:release factor glutamine methyltransferase
MNAGELLARARATLSAAGLEESGLDAEVLLAKATGKTRTGLIASINLPVGAEAQAVFEGMVARRANREPLQYITGHQEFFGLDFEVGPGVLVPRPETELIIEEAGLLLKGLDRPLAADIGTGSGCIAVSIAVSVPDAEVYATEISGAALGFARRNIEKHGAGGRVRLLEGDLFGPLTGLGLEGKFDLIASNPPYIPSAEVLKLMPEVRDWEPAGALDGGPDGLDAVRRLINEAPKWLKPGGCLLVEIGFDQSDAVRDLVESSGSLFFKKYLKDFANYNRILVATK